MLGLRHRRQNYATQEIDLFAEKYSRNFSRNYKTLMPTATTKINARSVYRKNAHLKINKHIQNAR